MNMMKPIEGDLKEGLERDRLKMYAMSKQKSLMANAKTLGERKTLLKMSSNMSSSMQVTQPVRGGGDTKTGDASQSLKTFGKGR